MVFYEEAETVSFLVSPSEVTAFAGLPPTLQGGGKGHNIKGNYLPGAPPFGGGLRFFPNTLARRILNS